MFERIAGARTYLSANVASGDQAYRSAALPGDDISGTSGLSQEPVDHALLRLTRLVRWTMCGLLPHRRQASGIEPVHDICNNISDRRH